MSRGARESMFPGGSYGHRSTVTPCSSSLLDCVGHMADVCSETHDTQQLLRNGTFDLKRMGRVLDSQRVFLFVNESMVKKYKEDLGEEIEPQILELVERAKKGLKVLERKHYSLQNKVGNSQMKKTSTHRSVQDKMNERKLRILTGQRQDLERELETLQREIESLEVDYDPTL